MGTLLQPETQVVNNASLSIVQSSWDLNQLKAAGSKGTKSTGDVIGFTQGINWAIDVEGELEEQQGAVEEETCDSKQSCANSNENNQRKSTFKEDEQVKRAIVHSFVSRRPWKEYSIEHYQQKEIPLPRFPK